MGRKPVRRWGALVVVLLLILGGQGLGLFSAAVDDGEGARPLPGEEDRAGGANNGVPAAPPGGSGGSTTGSSGSEHERTPASPPLDEDSTRALLAAVARVPAETSVADGYRALDTLGAQDLSEPVRQEVVALVTTLDQTLDAAVKDLAHALEEGRIAAARDGLLALRKGAHPKVTAALEALTRDRGWQPLSGPASDGPIVPAPRPLAARRAVDWLRAESTARVQVVQDRGTEVTVRLERDGGVTFPTARRCDLVPVAPDAGERVGQCRAALRAGEVELARLWLCAALAAGCEDEVAGLRLRLR